MWQRQLSEKFERTEQSKKFLEFLEKSVLNFATLFFAGK